MDPKKQIRDVVLKHLRANVEGLDEREIDTSQPMAAYGATSLDLIEVVTAAMRELKLSIPRTQLAGLENIDELVDVFVKKKSQEA